MSGRLSDHSGTIIEQYVLSLFVLAIIMPVAVSCLLVAINSFHVFQPVQDEIAVAQLRRILMVSDDIRTDQESVTFVYHGEQWYMQMYKNRLFIKPGTQIVIDNIDSCKFYLDGNSLVIVYVRDSKVYERTIAVIP